MSDLPSSLALTSIATDAEIISSDHRNNYSAIQSAVNALIAVLSGGSSNQILRAASSTAVDWTGGAFQAYTPSWTSTGTAPAIGNGTLSGRSTQLGKLVICRVEMVAGSTTTFGSGNFRFSLPVDASATMQASMLAVGQLGDSSAGAIYGCYARLVTASTVELVTNAQPGGGVSGTAPFTWASGDSYVLQFMYEAV